MNILGIGGFELLLIILIALFIVGPSNLLIFIRKTKIIYSEFKQKRDELISVVEQTIDIDDDIEELKNIKESLSDVSEKTSKSLKKLKKDLDK
jgi:Sec-independent protein translocase protein TatA|tara:strand:- start:6521 stop:6799 length:279 start_codon:yes stop_codon:yes gene_type:complete